MDTVTALLDIIQPPLTGAEKKRLFPSSILWSAIKADASYLQAPLEQAPAPTALQQDVD